MLNTLRKFKKPSFNFVALSGIVILTIMAVYPLIAECTYQKRIVVQGNLTGDQACSPQTLDYDGCSSLGSILHCLKAEGSFYRPDRAPGSPVYTLICAFMLFWVQRFFGLGHEISFLNYFSLIFSLFSAVILYSKIKKMGADWRLNVLGCLAFSLHPLFLWHSFSMVEDAFALFLMMLAWKTAEKKEMKMFSLVAVAMAVGSKFSSIGLLPLVLTEFLDKEKTGSFKKLAGSLLKPLLAVFVLSFLFILPALASVGMNPFRFYATDLYGTKSALQRAEIGWFLIRTTILWWIPAGIFLILQYIKTILKTKSFRLIEKIDVLIFCLFVFALAPVFWGGPVFLLIGAVVFRFYFAGMKADSEQMFIFWRELFIILSFAFALFFVVLYPFSRSICYFALIPGIILLKKRFQGLVLWFFIAAFTFFPMFHYIQLTAKKLLIHKQGYYWALKEKAVSHYNDYGFVFSPKSEMYEFYFPWVRSRE